MDQLTKYERARVIGARALQISQGAPVAVKLSKKEMEELKYNPVEIAKREYEKESIPIEVRRIIPKQREEMEAEREAEKEKAAKEAPAAEDSSDDEE